MKNNYTIILASASPRRQELLKTILKEFVVFPSPIEEIVPDDVDIYSVSEYLACEKARDVLKTYSDAIVIGADTTVICDGQIFGKPKTKKEATDMLTALSDNTHEVVTGVCICYGDKQVSFSNTTKVTFYPMTKAEMKEYIDTGDSFDKAGAYGIQGYASRFIKKIDGDYYSVMGLPVAQLYQTLKLMKIKRADK